MSHENSFVTLFSKLKVALFYDFYLQFNNFHSRWSAFGFFTFNTVLIIIGMLSARLHSLFLFLLLMIKNHTQTSVDFCLHHFFNDFKKFHPFVTLPPVATLSLRQWCASWFLHRSFFYSKTKLDLFPQWPTSKNIQFNDFFAQKSLTANCTFLHENGTFIR